VASTSMTKDTAMDRLADDGLEDAGFKETFEGASMPAVLLIVNEVQ